jgi:uncharacterized protein YegL
MKEKVMSNTPIPEGTFRGVTNVRQVPCVLLLDTSGSMNQKIPPDSARSQIDLLNDKLPLLKESLKADNTARLAVELAVITFGNTPTVAQDWCAVDDFNPPTLQAAGTTPLADALNRAMDLIDERKMYYRNNGIGYYQPWVFILTDGEPDNDALWPSASARVLQAANSKRATVFAWLTQCDPNDPRAQKALRKLAEVAPKPLFLDGARFDEIFVWLSKSLTAVSNSREGDRVQTPVPTGTQEFITRPVNSTEVQP